jgi:hypothetical protein
MTGLVDVAWFAPLHFREHPSQRGTRCGRYAYGLLMAPSLYCITNGYAVAGFFEHQLKNHIIDQNEGPGEGGCTISRCFGAMPRTKRLILV